MTEFLNTDGLKVSRDAALELMVHHLKMAHIFFQCTSDDADEKSVEARRLFEEGLSEVTRWVDDGGLGYNETVKVYLDSPEIVAGMEWIARLEGIYEEMKSRD